MPPVSTAPDAALSDVDIANGHYSVDDAVVASLRSRAHRRSEVIQVARIIVRGLKVPKIGPDGRPLVIDGVLQEEDFSFRIRRLQRKERLQAETLATHDEQDPRFPNPNITRQVTNQHELECRLLYTATVRADRERYWDDAELQQEWGVGTGYELIGELLGDRQQMEAILALQALGDGITQERERLKDDSVRAAI
jgi:hypothetical protein